MSQKIALVTGAMGGLGTAICQALAKDGCIVAANCLPNFEPAAAWLGQQEALGFKFYVAEGDVSDFESCKAMVAKIEADLGPVDILVNNAGITRDKFFAKMDKAQWDAVIATNLSSLFNVTQQVSPKMAERGWGRIINISSVNGVKGQAGQTNYSAAKAGVIGFTKALAAELATKGVTVNAIAPGYIGTDMVMAIREDIRQAITDSVPMKRLGRPDEIGGAVSYLASEIAGYVTGSTLNINGGLNYQ
ncbi:beta-ketoacyl-ACP reductase [Azospirillum brasilense]|uniref:Nodulation protein G n=2 Tax=Azospirillum brasilense TaxID=192 RepID=NODG_AZOBR|nr:MULTISPECIES: beta-ketoacyl-ACP reductase [Azospirillum]P17611.2 RecName: Full=Nodulation protein G [Azospirillum brasilense]ALJ38543.1 3-ketoacyl-ACP reductase [Azospirillum brasilense]MBB3264764.1 acetoacetyl-CoA reductase [Azospirillum sp. OGB3]MDW7553205.1 beta-ketoacyl-ACP reductase [Azospirillum brasilense]MDW7593416.1 beta-ketoacyl-ACP reductase [Azospirillum brasilense]MDW7628524.1 beta-ketoacyl-ACP reductase [Azospirillum brasilense]